VAAKSVVEVQCFRTRNVNGPESKLVQLIILNAPSGLYHSPVGIVAWLFKRMPRSLYLRMLYRFLRRVRVRLNAAQ
jgi:hypothetical protein